MKLRNKKTGEIGQIGYVATSGGEIIVEDISGEEYPYSVISSYKTLAELNEEWEDYNPKEPLIKDEKIRKAVRAWAEVSDVGVARVAPFAVFDTETSARIFFYSRVIEDKDYDEEKTYTIAELCGEEGE